MAASKTADKPGPDQPTTDAAKQPADEPVTPMCGNCQAFLHQRGSVSGECRRHAPRAVDRVGAWPKVRPQDWCLEFSE